MNISKKTTPKVIVLLAMSFILAWLSSGKALAMTQVAIIPERSFYNWDESSATKYDISLWYTGSEYEETVRVRVWTRYWNETNEVMLLNRNYTVPLDSIVRITNYFYPHKRQSSSWSQTNHSRWLTIYIEVTKLGTGQIFTNERQICIDYNWTTPRKQENTNYCGVAAVQMMVYHIRDTLHSQTSIGFSDTMLQYRQKANNLISGNSAKGNPYAELLRESSNYTFSSYVNQVLSKDMRTRDYHLLWKSGHLNAPIVKPAVLPYYPSTATTGHYVLVIGYDLLDNAILLDPHYDDRYFGFHKVDGNILLDANRAHQFPGWFLQSNLLE
jgi:hypothetical protein